MRTVRELLVKHSGLENFGVLRLLLTIREYYDCSKTETVADFTLYPNVFLRAHALYEVAKFNLL